HPPCTPLRRRTTGSSAPSLRARRFSCTDACPGAVEVTNQPAAERLASKTTGTFLVSPCLGQRAAYQHGAQRSAGHRPGIHHRLQALDDANEAVTRANRSVPFDRTVITPNRK